MKRLHILLISILLYSCGSITPGLPISTNNNIVKHKYYTLSYVEKHEQAEWVAYYADSLFITTKTRRTNNFKSDTAVHSGSATIYDYRGSGYDKGHLCPASDMQISKQAMNESFYMSNMSPQKPEFNRGGWQQLEELTRKWTLNEGQLFIITGPILHDSLPKIGKNKVSVPKYYYKILFDYTKPEIKAIAFLMPNKLITRPLQEYIVPIDSIETLTGIDFLNELHYSLEKKIEKGNNYLIWKNTD